MLPHHGTKIQTLKSRAFPGTFQGTFPGAKTAKSSGKSSGKDPVFCSGFFLGTTSITYSQYR
jgi:hypothetical protein